MHPPEHDCVAHAKVKCRGCVCRSHSWGLMGLLSVAPGRGGEQPCVCNVPHQTLLTLPFSKLFSMNHKPSTPPLQISSFREGKIHLPEPSVNQKCLPNPPAIRPALTSMTVASKQSYKGGYAESTLVLDCNACCITAPGHRLYCTLPHLN